jgi:hypothetical protein
LGNKLLSRHQELDGILSPITELDDQVAEQLPLCLVLGHAAIPLEMNASA